MKVSEYTQANRAAWNASAPHHRTGPVWDELVAGFEQPAFSVLDETLTHTLTEIDVNGKSVVQIGCNNGREVLSTCALGARNCLGIDVSEEFIDAAHKLNEIAGRECDFLCSDIYDLPADTRSDFDIVLITIGVINWMPDPQKFFEVVASLLKKDGSLLIYETHPFLEVFDPHSDEPFKPTISYFQKTPWVDSYPIVYDGSSHSEISPSYWFNHSLGTIVTACGQNNMFVTQLREYPHSNREVDYDIYRDQQAQLPLCYTLVASRQ